MDRSGNVLIAGGFLGTVDFGGGSLPSDDYDIYLAKLGPHGNHLWSHSFGDAASQFGFGVAVDGAGNTFITGRFEGSVDFGGGALTSAGFGDIFLAKFDSDGNLLWSQSFGDSSFQEAYTVAVDGAGNVLITGVFGSTVDFGGGPLTSAGGSEIFLAKFDPSGNHLWSHRFGDWDNQYGISVAVDGSGNVLLTGYFFGIVDFGGVPLLSAGDYDIFLAKFDPNGNHLWSQSFGNPAWQFGISVAADGSKNVLLTGYFEGTVDFGGGPLLSASRFDIYLAKFDPSGSHLWSQRFGSGFDQRSFSVAADAAGDVFITGDFYNTVDFGGGPLMCEGMDDVYLAKFDPNGHHLFSQRFGDSGAQHGKCVAVDAPGNVLLVGDFSGTVDFGSSPLTSAGAQDIDIFLVRFNSVEPTPVLLSQVSAREVDFAIELSWIALSDVSIAQFEIYRAVSPVEEPQRLATVDAASMEQSYRDDTVVSGETYHYWIDVVDIVGGRSRFGPFSITFTGTGETLILGNFPNPVVDQTTIRLYLPEPGDVILRVYDSTGRLVRTLVQALRPAGSHAVSWDGTNQAGAPVSGGVYFYQLRLNGQTQTRRMILIR